MSCVCLPVGGYRFSVLPIQRVRARRLFPDGPQGGLMSAIATVAARPEPGVAAPQYMRALERANRVRLARADLKRRVGEGELTVAEVILDTPWEAESMSISDLLTSHRRWGN